MTRSKSYNRITHIKPTCVVVPGLNISINYSKTRKPTIWWGSSKRDIIHSSATAV